MDKRRKERKGGERKGKEKRVDKRGETRTGEKKNVEKKKEKSHPQGPLRGPYATCTNVPTQPTDVRADGPGESTSAEGPRSKQLHREGILERRDYVYAGYLD